MLTINSNTFILWYNIQPLPDIGKGCTSNFTYVGVSLNSIQIFHLTCRKKLEKCASKCTTKRLKTRASTKDNITQFIYFHGMQNMFPQFFLILHWPAKKYVKLDYISQVLHTQRNYCNVYHEVWRNVLWKHSIQLAGNWRNVTFDQSSQTVGSVTITILIKIWHFCCSLVEYSGLLECEAKSLS